MSLAFPEPDVAPIAGVAIAPVLWAARGVGPRRGAWLGFVFGLGFFGTLLIWIKFVGWIAWAVLVLLQSMYVMMFGAGWGTLSRRFVGPLGVLGAAALWVAVEFIRQATPVVGFPWGQLAQSQHDLWWLLRYAAVAGGWAVAFVVVVINGLLLLAVEKVRGRELRSAIAFVLGAGVLLALPLLLMYERVHHDYWRARVAIVQGNVPRYFAGSINEKETKIMNSHVALTRSLANRDLDLVIWPESALLGDIDLISLTGESVGRTARFVDAEMVVGGNKEVDEDRYQVMAYRVDRSGVVVDQYQKTHLVPFGEYVPWRSLLGWMPMLEQIPRDAVPGDTGKTFELDQGRVIPVISFEGDFGSLVRERVNDAGGGLLVVATNTSTWDDSWASAQHLAFSQVRAAENNIMVAHAALSGISAFIDTDGRVIEQTDLWERDTLVGYPAVASGPTLYTRYGDWLPLLCLVLGLVGVVGSYVRRPGTVEPI